MYIKLARAGFISTSTKLNSEKIYLLPEIQFEYAVLFFEDLHISKKVQKLIKKDEFFFTKSFDIEVLINKIDKYHKDSWLCSEYKEMLLNINQNHSTYNYFELVGFELISKKTKEIVAGEIGYIIGSTYTSLTGFFENKKEYNNCGKLQLVFLSKYLNQNKFSFWNLGHACLQYKIDLGAKIVKREEFLKIWYKNI